MLPDEIKNSHRKDFHKSIIFSLFKCQSFSAKNFQQHSSRLSTDSSNFPRAKEVEFHIYNIHFAGTAFCAIALQNLLRNGFLEQFIIFFRADAPSASFTWLTFFAARLAVTRKGMCFCMRQGTRSCAARTHQIIQDIALDVHQRNSQSNYIVMLFLRIRRIRESLI
jgi:hypothetical protein